MEASSFEGEMPKMEGETAVVYASGDALSSAAALNNFAKRNKFLKILGGIFESNDISERIGVMALASIPSREVLLSQFLNIINSPKRGLVVALSEIAKRNKIKSIHKKSEIFISPSLTKKEMITK